MISPINAAAKGAVLIVIPTANAMAAKLDAKMNQHQNARSMEIVKEIAGTNPSDDHRNADHRGQPRRNLRRYTCLDQHRNLQHHEA